MITREYECFHSNKLLDKGTWERNREIDSMISFFFYCLFQRKIIKRLERTEFHWSMLRTGNKRQRRTDRWFASMETADGPMRGGYSPFRTGASAFRLSRLLLPNRRKNLCRQTKWYLFRPTTLITILPPRTKPPTFCDRIFHQFLIKIVEFFLLSESYHFHFTIKLSDNRFILYN